mgnify:CR=1 FL=1
MSKKSKTRRILVIVAVIFLGMISGTTAFAYIYFGQGAHSDNQDGYISDNNSVLTPNLNKRVSFLLIGADKRPGDNSFNADTIIVASFDPDTKLISLLSIPRDTRVTVSGSDSFVKINAVPMLRGIEELQNVVSELIGIELDGYVLTNFEGFKEIIDTLGGVTIDVEKDMYEETGDKTDGYIDLKAGLQRLDGSKALGYVRWRGDNTADIGRTARQQKLLTAVAKEILQPSTITKLPKLVPQLMNVVETNLKLADLLRLSKAATSFESSNIVTQTLPGYGLYLDYLSYWEVNRDTAKRVAQNLLMGITTDAVIDNTVLDLLDPVIRAHITVPGGPKDPNGQGSTGYEEQITDPNSNSDSNIEPDPGPDPDLGTDPGNEPDPGPDPGSGTDPGNEPDPGIGPGTGTDPGNEPDPGIDPDDLD